MRRTLTLLVGLLLGSLVLAGCGGAGADPADPDRADDGFYGAVLDQPYRVPDVRLEDTTGLDQALPSRLDKPLTLVFFGYTNCPDICIAVMSDLASAMARLSKADAAKVQVWFVTTDPARDTVPVMRTYLARFDKSFIGLTGTMPEIKQAGNAFHLAIEKGKRLPSGGYEVTHSTPVLGIVPNAGSDSGGDVRIVWTEGTSAAKFATDIHDALATPGAVRVMIPLSIPSPSQGVWHLGPLPIRGYALCIILGIVVAVWLGERRLVARGGKPGQVQDIAIFAVPFGIVGGRLYHVATDWEKYFGEGKHPVDALKIWNGGLGIWGAIALGAVGAWIGARRAGVRFAPLADALAPGIVMAQGIGRWGNWFNQELFGRPTNLPWGLEIDQAHRQDLPEKYQQFTTFHPAFLYEFVWDFGVAGLVLWADRRFKLGHGRAFALYVAAYCVGRGWIEMLRIDPVQENDVFGLRLNVWTSLILFLLSTGYIVVSSIRRPGREESALLDPDETEDSNDEAEARS
jgi:prolipoprotein diacylglyceryl transferase